MPLRRGVPLKWQPRGLSDSADGTNAFPGAMQSLSNLIHDPSTPYSWMARPPALDIAALTNNQALTALLVVGNTAYGMVGDGSTQDTPFAIDLLTGQEITITGVTSGNKPTSQATTGDWTPPIMAQVGGRIIVTHPGFAGDQVKFGWFDISGFSASTVGDTTNGSPVITGFPEILGVQPGMAITGTGVPASTTVLSIAFAYTAVSFEADSHTTSTLDGIASTTGMFIGMIVTGPGVAANTTIASVTSGTALLLSKPTTTTVPNGTFVVAAPTTASSSGRYSGTQTSGSPTITLASTFGLWVGQDISGAGIPLGSTIISLVANTSITISQNATLTGLQQFSVSGAVIIMSANATASGNTIALSIAGGTRTAPQWGAGDTQINNLPSVPVGVAQMAARAYFVCGTDGIVFSDSGFPCQVSNQPRVQALTTGDGLACTAIGPIMLASSLLGGIVQSLIVFEGAYRMQQITGDMTTNNLAMNALPVSTGTLAPLTVTTCEQGLAFVSPEGLRVITHLGQVSDPVGDAGQGITVPFIYAVTPSRMCAAANAHVIRITVQNGAKTDDPYEEYWYDIGRKSWCGPHNSTAALIQPWGDEFVLTFIGSTGRISVSPVVPQSDSSYFEEGGFLIWQYMPTLLPDNDDMSMNALVDMTLACGGPFCGTTPPNEPLIYSPVTPGQPPVGPNTPPELPPNEPPPPPERPNPPTTPTRTAGVLPQRITGVDRRGDVFVGRGDSGGSAIGAWWNRALTQTILGATWTTRVSRDGTIAVGYIAQSLNVAAWWDIETLTRTDLTDEVAWGISLDKTLILGSPTGPVGDPAQVWTRATGVATNLTNLTSGAGYSASGYSAATGITANNAMIVGMSRGVACTWTWPGGVPTALNNPNGSAAGIVSLWGYLASSGGGIAMACSDDGRVIVGQSATGATTTVPVYWLGSRGAIQALPLLTGHSVGYAFDCSADGSVIVGMSGTSLAGTTKPCVWINGDVLELPLPAGTQGGQPWAFSVSADGRTVGGGSGKEVSGSRTFPTWWDLNPV